jgi:hypothetical protein
MTAAEREAMTLPKIIGEMREYADYGITFTARDRVRDWADALDALSRTAEPAVPVGLVDALRRQRQIDEDGTECGVSRQAVDEAATILESLTHPSEDGRDGKVSELVAAARAYFKGYCVDEADDSFECGARYGVDTGCTREQHEAAARLRNALAAMAQERTNG